MITPVYAYEPPPLTYSASLFLMRTSAEIQTTENWWLTVLDQLNSQFPSALELIVFIPISRELSPYSPSQIAWETQYLNLADIVLVWSPSTTHQWLEKNHLLELTSFTNPDKLFYGHPPQFSSNLDSLYYEKTGRRTATELNLLIQEILTYLIIHLKNSHCPQRSNGECTVPLNIWTTQQFQSWYQTQKHVGNQLINAQLLWLHIIKHCHYTFSYALHVQIWIAAENRIKSNEFILSRPDISVVVPYWKHPTDLLASEIVLIKEFRAPARTVDGFVHELPGGSNFKNQIDKLQLASDELHEETSLRLDPRRFKYLASKQLVATWSTHVADVYAVALDWAEIQQAKTIAESGQTFGVKEDTEKTYLEVYQLRDLEHLLDWSMTGMIYKALLWQTESQP